jgi:hypothetical protein
MMSEVLKMPIDRPPSPGVNVAIPTQQIHYCGVKRMEPVCDFRGLAASLQSIYAGYDILGKTMTGSRRIQERSAGFGGWIAS